MSSVVDSSTQVISFFMLKINIADKIGDQRGWVLITDRYLYNGMEDLDVEDNKAEKNNGNNFPGFIGRRIAVVDS